MVFCGHSKRTETFLATYQRSRRDDVSGNLHKSDLQVHGNLQSPSGRTQVPQVWQCHGRQEGVAASPSIHYPSEEHAMWKPTTTPEDNYHGTMNTLLAPVRWLRSLAQTAILLVIAIGIGLAYPLIQYLSGQPVTLGTFEIPLLVVFALVTLLYAPLYLIFGGIGGLFLFGCLLGVPGFEDAIGGISVKWFVFGFLAVGILQKYIRTHLRDNPLPSGGQVGSGTREYDATRCEECGIDFSEPTEYCGQCGALQTASRSSRNEAVYNESNDHRGATDTQCEEQARFEEEHSSVIAELKEMVSSCRQPLDDALRGASVLRGNSLVEADEAIMMDLWEFSRRLELADGDFLADAPNRLLKALSCVVEPRLRTASDWEALMLRLYPTLAAQDTASTLGIPRVVSMLVLYDAHAGTHLASDAAATYRSLLFSMASLRRDSIAVKMVLEKYLRLLKPHISEQDADGTGFPSGRSSVRAGCAECVRYSAVLGLPVGASDSEVRQKRRAWAEVLHPDQLGSKSETARNAAEEQLKNINEACEHVLTCPDRKSASGDDNASQTTAPRQSAGNAAAAGEISPESSSSDDRTPAREERGYGIRSEQDLIADIDATRRKVEESTRKTEELLAELKQQALYRSLR